VPRLKCTFREFIAAIVAHGFKLDRQDGSHRQYVGVVNGKTRMVTVAFHNITLKTDKTPPDCPP